MKKLTVGSANLEHFFIGPAILTIINAIATLSGYEIDGMKVRTITRSRSLDTIFLVITVDEAQTLEKIAFLCNTLVEMTTLP